MTLSATHWAARLALLVCLFSLPAARVWAQVPMWQWATSPSSRGAGGGTAVDTAGNVYVAGYFTDSARFGTIALTSASAGSADVFVAKYSPAGACQWAVSAGGPGIDLGSRVAVGPDGNVYVSGRFGLADSAVFGTSTLINGGGQNTYDGFVAKLSPAGIWQWAVGIGGVNNEYTTGLVVDRAGNVGVSGYFQSTAASFGTLTVPSTNTHNTYVAKLNPGGQWLWAVGATSGNPQGAGLAADSSGAFYVCGAFTSPNATFGPIVRTNTLAGSNDLFVAKVSSAGVWEGAAGATGGSGDEANGIAVMPSGEAYIVGFTQSTGLVFNSTVSLPASTMFVAKLTPAGLWEWVTGLTGGGGATGAGIAADGSGAPYVTGQFFGTVGFGASSLTSGGSFDAFVAKMTPAGAWTWAVGAGGPGSDQGSGLAVDGDGRVTVAGIFRGGSASFGPITIPNPLGGTFSSPFIAHLGTNGVGLAEDASASAALALFPNPAHTAVQLTATPHAPVAVLDALGRAVCTTRTGAAGSATLDVRRLPAGLYVVRAGRATRRLVVE